MNFFVTNLKENEMTEKSHFDLRLAQIHECPTSSSKYKIFIDIQLPLAWIDIQIVPYVILNQGH